MRRLLISLTFIFAQLAGCATNPVTGKQDLVLMSEEQEISLGRQTNQQVLQQYTVYDDQKLQAYVQSIGQKLATHSHRNDLIYRFTVLDSKEVNAFALPGGYIYITRGLMGYLNSEAELAAVLGHEIGHVTARHSVQQYSAAQLANIGATLGAIFIPGMNTQASNALVQLFGTALLRGYGRDHELQADQLGAEYLARTGYNPQAMLDVIRVLKNQEAFETRLAEAEGREPNVYHGLFSTHPDNDTRLQEVIGYANRYQGSGLTFVGREDYLENIDGMIYGDNSKEGILRGRNFYHPDLGFALRVPQDWRLNNNPDSLMLTAPQGAALIQVTLQDINKRVSPREFMVSRLGLKKLENDLALNIHGLDAHTGLAPVNTSYGARMARFTVIYFNNQAYIIAGVAKNQQATAQYDQNFLDFAQSFHPLTDNERLKAQPLKLVTQKAGLGTRFADLAGSSPLENYPEQQLRLINGMYPDGEPQTDMILKVVE